MLLFLTSSILFATLAYMIWWLYRYRDYELYNPFAPLDELLPWLEHRYNNRPDPHQFKWAMVFGNAKIELCLPADVETILSVRGKLFPDSSGLFKSFIKRPVLPKIFRDILGRGIFTVSGDDWQKERNEQSIIFKPAHIRDYVKEIFTPEAEYFIKELQRFRSNKDTFDLHEYLSLFTLTTILKVTFDKNSGIEMFSDENRCFNKATNWLIAHSTKCLRLPMWRVIRFYHTYITGRYTRELRTFQSFLNKYRKSDMPASRIANLILAGKDTTAAAISWVIYELFQPCNCEYYEKLMNLSGDARERYLELIIYETLRLHPVVSLEYKDSIRDVTLHSGIKIMKGETVGHSPYLFGRKNDGTWGKTPANIFNPGRWVEVNEKHKLNNGFMSAAFPYLFPVFNAGPRICQGRTFAMAEMKIAISSLIKHYVIKINNGLTSGKPDTGLVSAISGGLWVTIEDFEG